MAIARRQGTGDAKRWKAMSHPLRREMLRHLEMNGPATSTTLAQALGDSTGTTSYHLRILADAGIIEEAPGIGNGRERWWRTLPGDVREPDYDSLSAEDRAALDEWRAGQAPGELDLVNRFLRDVRRYGGHWAAASRSSAWYTPEDLDALHDEYVALLGKYGHGSRQDAPPGARLVHLRMFYLPDDPPEAMAAEPAAGRPGSDPDRELRE